MILFRINDVTVNSKKVLATGELIVGDKSFKAVSGGWGKGALPVGLYNISIARKLDDKGNGSYKKEGFPWFASIMPMFDTDRTAFGIHPDGGEFFGTLGCIGIEEGDLELFTLLNKSDMLKVI